MQIAGLAYASPDTPEMQFGSLVNSRLGAIANPLHAPSVPCTRFRSPLP